MGLVKPIVELGKAEGQWTERVWHEVATYSLLMAVTAAPGLLAHTCPEHPPGLLLHTVSSICFAKKGLHRYGGGKGWKGGRRQVNQTVLALPIAGSKSVKGRVLHVTKTHGSPAEGSPCFG